MSRPIRFLPNIPVFTWQFDNFLNINCGIIIAAYWCYQYSWNTDKKLSKQALNLYMQFASHFCHLQIEIQYFTMKGTYTVGSFATLITVSENQCLERRPFVGALFTLSFLVVKAHLPFINIFTVYCSSFVFLLLYNIDIWQSKYAPNNFKLFVATWRIWMWPLNEWMQSLTKLPSKPNVSLLIKTLELQCWNSGLECNSIS